MKLQDLLRHLYYEPSLITPEAHASIRDVLERHFARRESLSPSLVGHFVDPASGQVTDKVTDKERLQREAEDFCGDSVDIPQAELINGIMHIPVGGVMGNKLHPFERAGGAVDVQDLMQEISDAESNPQCRGVLFLFDSPGGMLSGIPELSDRISSMQKDNYAFCDGGQICSAAYWAASSCHGIFATQSASIGNVGVYLPILDSSAAFAARGLTVELIRAGKYKGIAHPGTSLKASDRAYLQDRVNSIYSMFTAHMERTRPDIQAADLEGQYFFGEEAVAHGFLDAVVRNQAEVLELFG